MQPVRESMEEGMEDWFLGVQKPSV